MNIYMKYKYIIFILIIILLLLISYLYLFKKNDYMDYKYWKDRDETIYNFFKENIDRHYVTNHLYPGIGKYVSNSNNRILNIGYEWYNKYDYDLIMNKNIMYYGLDINDIETPNNFTKTYKIDLVNDDVSNIGKYDIIVDYGVIGWPNINANLTQNQIESYINNILTLLYDDGLYLLKIDVQYDKNNNTILMNTINKHFKSTNMVNIKYKELYDNNNLIYKTYVLKKII
jgi:hypothetical protein